MTRVLKQRNAGRIGGRQNRLLIIFVLPFQESLGADYVPSPDAGKQVSQGGCDVFGRGPRRRRPRHAADQLNNLNLSQSNQGNNREASFKMLC